MASLTFDEAIDRIGFGRFQKKLLAICGLGWAADAMEILIIAFALPSIAAEWKLDNAQKGLLSTAVFLGMLAGAWFWGRLSDVYGRKVGFMITVAISSVFGLLSAFAPNYITLVILRALIGFGIGGMLPVDYAIFAEFLPTQKRGRYLVYLESFWALGSVLAAGLSWLIVPSLGWRWLFGILAIPALLIFFIRSFIPESPRYSLVKGDLQHATEILKQVARENGRPMPKLKLIATPPAPKTAASDLLKPSIRRTTLLLWLVWFFISLGYYGIFTWLPAYFKTSSQINVYLNSFILALAQLPGYFSAAFLVERLGRRRTLSLYLLASGIFTYLFAAAANITWVLAMGIWMSFFALGAWGALYAYTPEAYPTALRGTGMGTASGMTRISGAIAPSLGAALMGGGLVLPLTVFAVAYLIASAAAFGLPETSQQPLQDVIEA